MLKTAPAVFVVGNSYQIMVPVTKSSLFWVEVGDKCYYDEQNGIMRSLCTTHRVTVPMEELDKAGKYTVCEREIIDRKPYFPETEDTVKTEFAFYPVPKNNIRAYHIADTHNMVDEPARAAELFGKLDLLILNGDIPDHSGEIKNYDTIYKITERLTGGSIPTVFVRGNHDLRGYYAEQMAEHTPNDKGNTYFTFRIGNIWGIALDCGEDKEDGHPEYGLTVSCHCFRERQTEFIKQVIANADKEYAAEGVKHRLIVSHNPFAYQLEPPFDIEADVYKEWLTLLKENIHPTLMLSGHLHELKIAPIGGDRDTLGQPCTVVIGSDKKYGYHAGCGLVFNEDGSARLGFYGSDGEVIAEGIKL